MDKRPAEKLTNFRKRHGISLHKASELLGASGPTILSWEQERTVPRPPYRRAIEIWTKGEISETEWQSPGERAAIERTADVKPFEPESADDSGPSDPEPHAGAAE